MATSIRSYFTVTKCVLRDLAFVYGRPALGVLSAVTALVCLVLRMRAKSVGLMLAASRYTNGLRFSKLLRSNIGLIIEQSPRLCGRPVDLSTLEGRCVVLSLPRYTEGVVSRKGVLLVSFTETAGKLFVSTDPALLCRLFHIVLEPSWSGYADPSILCWCGVDAPVIVQSTDASDRLLLRNLSQNLVPVPYGAGDWIDPDRFHLPDSTTKLYDSICVANFGWWKRVHAFAKAVGQARQTIPSYRAALVLAAFARTESREREIQDLLSHYSIEDAVDLYLSIGPEQLRALYAQSRVLVFPSWKEGSSRVLFEAMSADTPVVVLARNSGVNKDYINRDTGSVVSDESLPGELIAISRGLRHYAPRRWFLRNLGPVNTTEKLASDLASLFPHESWTPEDLWVKANVPEATRLNCDAEPPSLSSIIRH